MAHPGTEPTRHAARHSRRRSASVAHPRAVSAENARHIPLFSPKDTKLVNMPAIHIDLYEALTEAGVKPDAARRVERQVESAIVNGQEVSRQDMLSRLMSKEDGMLLRADVHKAISAQTLRLLGLVFVMNSVLLALARYLPG